MDRPQLSRLARMVLPAGVLWIAGCGAQSAAPEKDYNQLPGLVRLESPAELISPTSTTPPLNRRATGSRIAGHEQVTIVPVSGANYPATLDPGARSTPSVPLPVSLSERAPAFDLDAIEEPDSTDAAEHNPTGIADAAHAARSDAVQLPSDAPPTAVPNTASNSEAPLDVAPQPAAPEASQSILVTSPGEGETAGERGMLPWAKSGLRTAEMQVVSARSMRMSQEGFRLADRGAIYSARGKFVESLRGLTRALDVEQQTNLYMKALTAGITALNESSDFVPRSGASQDIDVKYAMISHRTPVLKHVEGELPPATIALQRYYTYAQEQLATAAGQDPAGSFALYGLGRISLAPEQSGLSAQEKVSQAIVFHQAALLADPRNFLAANEAGVLLADAGRLEQARALLIQSLSVVQQAPVWQNLATVQRRLGEAKLAEDAHNRAATLAGPAGVTAASGKVVWVDPATFARVKSASDGLQVPMTASKPAVKSAEVAKPQPAKPSASAWLPWSKSTRR